MHKKFHTSFHTSKYIYNHSTKQNLRIILHIHHPKYHENGRLIENKKEFDLNGLVASNQGARRR